jgi:hypothetical protein
LSFFVINDFVSLRKPRLNSEPLSVTLYGQFIQGYQILDVFGLSPHLNEGRHCRRSRRRRRSSRQRRNATGN